MNDKSHGPDNQEFVSICLLTYNRANDLQRSINSLLTQTHSNFELIINDDRSTDNTEELCRSFEKVDKRVRYFKNSVNRKYAGNSNEALKRASSEYIAIVHDGDEYERTLIEKWISGLLKHQNASLAFCGNNIMNANWSIESSNLHNYPELIQGNILLDEMLLKFACPIWGIVMIKKSSVIELGCFDESKPRLTDVDMWMRLLSKFNAVYINEALINIAPREVGHENAYVNWRIFNEIIDIRKTNIDRNYKPINDKYKFYKMKFNRDLLLQYCKYMLSCVKRLQIRLFFDGVKMIPTLQKKLY